ncbi:MAG: AsmA family protein [Desulfobacterales bacterium]|nr:AsmA family protein [Desulfobacterales bacterium]
MHWKKIVGFGVLLIFTALVAVYVVLATYDYNRLKPHLARMVKAATGRELRLDGDLKLTLGLAPVLVANHAVLTNASWGSQPEMIKVENLRLQARLLPLLSRTVELTHIGLAGAELLLETDASKRRNWDFKAAASPEKRDTTASGPLKLDFDHIHIANLTLVYRQATSKSVKRFHFKRVDLARQGDGDTQSVDLQTEVNGQPVVITGTTGAIEQFWARQRFPVNLTGTYAGAAATIDGNIDRIRQLKGVDLELKFSGKEFADLGPLVAMHLPAMGAFDVRSRLTGSATALAIQAFEARLDQSDFKGRGKVDWHKKPKIFVRLESSRVDVSTLIDHLEKDEPPTNTADKPRRRLFSDTPLPLDVLQKLDADVVLKAKHIQGRNARLELGRLAFKIVDRGLHVENFEATYKKTRIAGNLSVAHGVPPQVAADILVQNLDLGNLLKETGKSDAVRAVIDIAAHGNSRGNSIRSLMANLDGAIGFVMGEGYLTHYLDMLAGGLSQKVIDLWDPPKAVDQINCAVVQFDIHKGLATSRAFVFDSRAAIITGAGEINLGTEQIDFLLSPEPKRPELRIRPNLNVRGTVLAPEVSVDKRSLLRSGARGLGTLAVGPAGLLAPFAHLGAHETHPCDVEGTGQGEPETSAEKRAPSP